MKFFQPAIIALCVASFSVPLAAQQSEQSKDWHKKSDVAKGVDQLAAPAKGKVYANPDRQKALDDAMNDDSSKPASGDSSKASKATPQR